MKRVLLAGCLILTTMSAVSQKHEVKVAMAQILALDGDLAGNFVRIEHAVAEAKEKGADIVAFPESCLLGWLNPSAHQRASTIPGNDTDKLCALAKQYGIFINIGLDEKVDGKLYGGRPS